MADSLLHFDTDRYDLERFIVMPNHIYLLVQMRPGWELRKQCEPWTHYTVAAINKLRGSHGEFWAEPFDHIVRNVNQFQYLQD